jgi:hypothetical protein
MPGARMIERRRHFRFEPTDGDDLAVVEGALPAGVVSNYSEGGICIVLHAGLELQVGQEVTVDYRGYVARAVVRNLTQDSMTTAYGLEWTPSVPPGMLPRRLRVAPQD